MKNLQWPREEEAKGRRRRRKTSKFNQYCVLLVVEQEIRHFDHV